MELYVSPFFRPCFPTPYLDSSCSDFHLPPTSSTIFLEFFFDFDLMIWGIIYHPASKSPMNRFWVFFFLPPPQLYRDLSRRLFLTLTLFTRKFWPFFSFRLWIVRHDFYPFFQPPYCSLPNMVSSCSSFPIPRVSLPFLLPPNTLPYSAPRIHRLAELI